MPATQFNFERRRVLRERMKRLSEQNTKLMEKIITALDTSDGEEADKGEKKLDSDK